MRIDSPKMTNTEATGSYSGSFIGDGSELTGLVSASHAVLSDSASFIDSANVSGLAELSSSLESRVAANELFSSSLDTTELVLTGSFTGSSTGSFTGSFAGVFVGGGAGITGIISSSYALTSSYNENAVISGSITGPNWIDFVTGSDQPVAEGRLGWDDGYGTLSLGLKGGNVNLQIGQEQVARVFNADTVQLTDGMVVYISGSQGNRVSVKRASADAELGSANTLGVVTEPIAVGAEGFVTTFGTVNGLNTLGLTPGAPLWLNSGSGEYSQNKPNAPYHNVLVGYVERVHETVGSIFVKIDNGYEIDELHNVEAVNVTDGDLLIYSASLWHSSKQLSGSYGLTGSLTADSFNGIFEGALSSSAQIDDDISGSLGPNATLIRSLTAAGISGSFTSISSSFEGRISANEDAIDSLTLVTSSYALEANISGSFTSLSQSVASDINEKLNIADTGSFAKVDVNNVFDGTQTFTNIAVNGTGSFAYIESITGSAKIIGDAFIVVNSEGTGSRFAGIQVIDSGSATTSSLQWDSLVNKWQYLNSGDVGYSGGGLLSGPRITGSQTVNDITYPTLNTLTRGQGGDHLYDSNITDDDTNIILGIDTQITGSLGVTGTITGNVTGNLTGNAATATSATDADTVDSLHASSFLRSDADDTGSGKITLTYHTTGDPYAPLELRGGGDHTGLYINPYANKQAHVRFATDGSLKWQIRVPFQDGTNTPLKFYTWDGGADKFVFNTNGSAEFNGGVVWTSANDGAGSGLDADTVDSLQASQFLRSDAADTTTGTLTISNTNPVLVLNDTNSSDTTTQTGYISLQNQGSETGWMGFGSNSSSNLTIYNSSGDITLTPASGNAKVGSNRILTVADEGSGNGLDADTVDGYHAAQTYTNTGNAAGSFLGGHYSSGGAEKPNSSTFGKGKLKIAMLGSGNLGFGGTWNDVLWISSYEGTDVKRSTAIVSSKYDNTSLWLVKQNYDATDWGTGYMIWNSGNDGAGSGLDADTLDTLQASQFLRSDANDTMTGTLTIQSSADAQLSLYGTDTWAGIGFNDSNSNQEYIWYNGGSGTFAIGGGGSTVSGKKLHVDGGMTVGANYDSTTVASNGLVVEGITGIGTNDFAYTANDNTPLVGANTNNKLFVNGSIQLLSNNDAIVIGRGTATFLKDEELGFGWGGGWYMTDGTYLRVRNTKALLTGDVIPASNNTYNLGSSSNRWANVYTNDLHLSNMHKEEGNDVDGTTGDWTIQEGEENLYIINNLTGKKYKIKLEEV